MRSGNTRTRFRSPTGLHHPDAGASLHGGELRGMAVAAQGNMQRPARLAAQGVQDRDVGRHAVGPGHRVPGKVRDGLRNAVPVEVGRRRENPSGMLPTWRAMSELWLGLAMRTTTSASWPGRSVSALVRSRSTARRGCRSRRAASIGGTTSMPTKSETLRRTGQATSDAAPSPSRQKASDA